MKKQLVFADRLESYIEFCNSRNLSGTSDAKCFLNPYNLIGIKGHFVVAMLSGGTQSDEFKEGLAYLEQRAKRGDVTLEKWSY